MTSLVGTIVSVDEVNCATMPDFKSLRFNFDDCCRVEFWEFCFHFLIVMWDLLMDYSRVILTTHE